MNEQEAKSVLDLANAEEAGRNLALVVRAFREEMLKEMTTNMSIEAIDELTVEFGKAIMLKVFLAPFVSEEDDEFTD